MPQDAPKNFRYCQQNAILNVAKNIQPRDEILITNILEFQKEMEADMDLSSTRNGGLNRNPGRSTFLINLL